MFKAESQNTHKVESIIFQEKMIINEDNIQEVFSSLFESVTSLKLKPLLKMSPEGLLDILKKVSELIRDDQFGKFQKILDTLVLYNQKSVVEAYEKSLETLE